MRNALVEGLRRRAQLEAVLMHEPAPEPVPAPAPKPKLVRPKEPEFKPIKDIEEMSLDEAVSALDDDDDEPEYHDHSDIIDKIDELQEMLSTAWGEFIVGDWDTKTLEDVRTGLLLCRSLISQNVKIKVDL